MKLTPVLAVSLLAAMTASVAHSAPQNYWHENGFTRFSAESHDGIKTNAKGKLTEGIVQEAHIAGSKYVTNPAPMKQAYDAEGLFYKRVGNRLYIGLQTGLDVIKGYNTWNEPGFEKKIYAGDIAISFKQPGASSAAKPLREYVYGVDFGTQTKDWGDKNGEKQHGVPLSKTEKQINAAGESGVYNGAKYGDWRNNTMFKTAAFAVKHFGDNKVANLLSNDTMTFKGIDGQSFARIVSFDLSKFGYTENDKFSLHAYWTMSCGNDNVWGSTDVNGTSEVPVPAAAWLFGSALLGLAGVKRKA